MTRLLFSFLLIPFFSSQVAGQNAIVRGWVVSGNRPVPFASVFTADRKTGASTNEKGYFELQDAPAGKLTLKVQAVGYVSAEKNVDARPGKEVEIYFNLREDILGLEEIVISGIRTDKRRIESAVAVNVLDKEVFDLTQSGTLMEGLNFQPGIRTEIDCQTCNYSQVRMNGLGGSYSQILINSRPVFSSLQGLYGLEQIPSSMIERVEIIRGGGSALYGSGAIAGVINIITRIPDDGFNEVSVVHALTAGESNDNMINAGISAVNEEKTAGVAVFASRRRRQAFEANDDGFSEMPKLANNSFGFNSFYRFNEATRIEFNGFAVNENRRGGSELNEPPHMAQQSEDRNHDVVTGGINLVHDWKQNNRVSLYISGQHTVRKHYTGIIPDIEYHEGSNSYDSAAYIEHFLNPPYGSTLNKTLHGGFQVDHIFRSFMSGTNTFTIGAEYLYDFIDDEIKAYRYQINQTSRSAGIFLQNEWASSRFTLLTGARITRQNEVDHWIVSPRASALYKMHPDLQLRATYAGGFRAPQAFDADLHIAFAGGGISYVRINPGLKEETSHSLSGSLDFNHSEMDYIYGFTLEAFFTRLNNSFVLEAAGKDDDGNKIIEKRNGGASMVKGMTIEARGNYNGLFQLETGLSLQKSEYENPVFWSAQAPGERRFLRTPETYGFYTISYLPPKEIALAWTGTLTGRMRVPHFGGAPGVDGDRVFHSPVFWNTNVKAEYDFKLNKINQNIRLSAGIRNIFNQYQQDFDLGKKRDSNYVYGPAAPRTIFFGVTLGALN